MVQKQVAYTDAQAARLPRQVVIGIAKDEQGKYNPITLGMFMTPSIKPPMAAVSIGHYQYSVGAFRLSREFVIAVPAASQLDEAMLYGTKSGRTCDKLALAHAKTEPATMIDGVLLSDAVANYECRLVAEFATGDHIVFVGEVVCSHIIATPAPRLYIVGPGHKMGGLERTKKE